MHSPRVYTPPDALGTSTGDSISTLPNTIRADTPRPSETGNMSTSVDSAGNATQQNDPIVDQILSLSNMTAAILSQSQKLPPWQAAVVEKSVSAMLSAVGGESKLVNESKEASTCRREAAALTERYLPRAQS